MTGGERRVPPPFELCRDTLKVDCTACLSGLVDTLGRGPGQKTLRTGDDVVNDARRVRIAPDLTIFRSATRDGPTGAAGWAAARARPPARLRGRPIRESSASAATGWQPASAHTHQHWLAQTSPLWPQAGCARGLRDPW